MYCVSVYQATQFTSVCFREIVLTLLTLNVCYDTDVDPHVNKVVPAGQLVVSCNLVDHIGTDLIVFVNAANGSCLCIVRWPLPVPCYCSIAILNASSQALQTS